MTEGRQELRPLLRDEPVPADSVVVVRGGPTSVDRLRQHAQRTHDAFTLDGEPLWGMSVFCALDDIGAASLDALLQRFASYRVVHLPTAGALLGEGFELLPTFGRPHYTVRLADVEDVELSKLQEALGPAQPNPYHGGKRPGRR